ncbi:hypothetical protein E0493_08590 [Roseomonas sp. M0104]|uniref:Uncharacterized protein n=1 Tax=Teichococcus coralli TaxID=2545983 RepID=A0A845BDH9_9PROT|nr:hypothetical protein [Pseudoroseomonas coralli]MXP63407.1 hypothetical protein [Pseudoroseomonas coralli]
MFDFSGSDGLWVWCVTPDGGLAIDRGQDRGDGRILLSHGGFVTRQRIIARGKAGNEPLSFFAALTGELPANFAAAVAGYIGHRLPDWLVAEMRFRLAEKVRDGWLILAGKQVPLAANAQWHSFDASALDAWDFRLDNTARPLVGNGDSYVHVTVFTQDQWKRTSAAKGRALPPPPSKAVEWMREAYSRPIKPKRDDAIEDCRVALGITVPEARAALATIKERRKRGRPRGGRG